MAEGASEGSVSFILKNIHNTHHLNIDVMKFDGTNTFGLWRCEVLNALNAQNLENSRVARETNGNGREGLEENEQNDIWSY